MTCATECSRYGTFAMVYMKESNGIIGLLALPTQRTRPLQPALQGGDDGRVVVQYA
jgi:hypothetical protein